MNSEEPQAFPLQWPIGRPRAKYRSAAPFRQAAGRERVGVVEGVKRVMDELRRFRARALTISTNLRPTLAGYPSGDRQTPAGGDPGVAVYFRLDDKPHCIACDKWDRVADNLAAVAAHIEAVRGQLRWGCGDAAQVFAGFLALPAMEPPKPWFEILGFTEVPTATAAEENWRVLIQREHPDRGGNANKAAEINAAWQQGRIALGVE